MLTPLLPSVLQEFFLQRSLPLLQPLTLPPGLSVRQALSRVLRLPAVASKRYLTNKVLPAPCSTPLALCTPPSARPSKEWLRGSIREGEGSGQRPHPLLPTPQGLRVQGEPGHPLVPGPLASSPWFLRWIVPWAAWWPSSSVWDPCRPPWQMWRLWH